MNINLLRNVQLFPIFGISSLSQIQSWIKRNTCTQGWCDLFICLLLMHPLLWLKTDARLKKEFKHKFNKKYSSVCPFWYFWCGRNLMMNQIKLSNINVIWNIHLLVVSDHLRWIRNLKMNLLKYLKIGFLSVIHLSSVYASVTSVQNSPQIE